MVKPGADRGRSVTLDISTISSALHLEVGFSHDLHQMSIKSVLVMSFKVHSLSWKQQLTNKAQLKVTLNVQFSVFVSTSRTSRSCWFKS